VSSCDSNIGFYGPRKLEGLCQERQITSTLVLAHLGIS